MDERAVPTKPAPTFPALTFPDTQAPFRYWVQMALPAVYGDELSYYELLSKVVKVLNDALANMNLLNEDVKELAEFTSRLSQWTQDYFKNLDIQQEVNKKLDQMAASGQLQDMLEKLFMNTYSVVNVIKYGADRTGATDSTPAVQKAIAAASPGQTVYFPNGSYKLGQVNLRSGLVYDFDGSSLLFTSDYGLVAEGKPVDACCAAYALTKSIAAGDAQLACTYQGSIPVGTLAVIENPSQQFQHDRAHYKTGYVCLIGKNNQMIPSCPIDISMEGCTVTLYDPAEVSIRNIGEFEFADESEYYQHGIVLRYCSASHVDNAYSEMPNYEGILMESSYGCQVSRYRYEDKRAHTAQQPEAHYAVSTKNSTMCGIRDCQIYSMWHAFSTGGDYLNYRTYAKDCTLFASSQFGFLDHNVAIGSLLENCTTSGAVIAAGATMRDCLVSVTGRHGTFSPTNGAVFLYGGALNDQTYTLENVVFDYPETMTNSNFGIAGSFDVTDGDATACTFGNVVVRGCRTLQGFPVLYSLYRSTGVPCSIGTVSFENTGARVVGSNAIPAGSSVKNIVFTDCHIDMSSALSNQYMIVNLDLFPNPGNVVFKGCLIDGNELSSRLISLRSNSARLMMSDCVINNGSMAAIYAITAYLSNVVATGTGLLVEPQNIEYLMMSNVSGKFDFSKMSGCIIGTYNSDAPRELTTTSVNFKYVLGDKSAAWSYFFGADGQLIPTKVK